MAICSTETLLHTYQATPQDHNMNLHCRKHCKPYLILRIMQVLSVVLKECRHRLPSLHNTFQYEMPTGLTPTDLPGAHPPERAAGRRWDHWLCATLTGGNKLRLSPSQGNRTLHGYPLRVRRPSRGEMYPVLISGVLSSILIPPKNSNSRWRPVARVLSLAGTPARLQRLCHGVAS
jgi:hypothetical protein